MTRSTLLAVVALFAAGSVQAQEGGRVTGVVTSEGGQPVSGANVTIAGTSLGAMTDADGRYTITGVLAGTQAVHTSMIGYAELTHEVAVEDGQSVTADFQLSTDL